MTLRRWHLLLVVMVAVVGFVSWVIYDLRHGPSIDMAFQRIFDRPIPTYARDLRKDHYKHLKGSGLYLGFAVPPDKLYHFVDIENAQPMYITEIDHWQDWPHETKFRQLYGVGFPSLESARMQSSTSIEDCVHTTIVFCPDTGFVFCFWLSDSDIDPANH
ncbi:MAG: hypothetical protein CMJ58_03650 [Planctomycetaceae bacterium]|nr:hypothetical protein [Planctomycetaceae bacterium]